MELLLRASHFDCKLCPLHATRTHIVDGAGPSQASLAIVGEAPGEEEDKYGMPFQGRSGILLRATLAENGFPEGSFFITNTVKCRPPENRNPTDLEIQACSGWLLAELANTSARVILALGKFAQGVLQDYESRGFLRDGVQVFNAWHPAYILRSPRNRIKWQEQIKTACDAARGKPGTTPPLPLNKPWTPGEPDMDSSWLAADTETDDLEEGIGVRRVAWTLSDGNTGVFHREQEPGPILRSRSGSLWMHNAKYDAPLLGVDLRRTDTWDDTMLAAYVLRYPEVGLKKLSPQLVQMPLRGIHDVLGRGRKRVSFSTALATEPGLAVTYAIEDAVATSRLARVLDAQLRAAPDRMAYYHTVEKPATPILYDLERRGILVDPDSLRSLGKELRDRIERGTLLVKRGLGRDHDTEFNRRSSQQLAHALIDRGVKLRYQTPTGKWRMDEAVLSLLAATEPAVHWALRAELSTRKLEKLLGTYVEPLLLKRDSAGRIHGRFNQTVTGTGRLSSNDPNLQNIPIRTPLGKQIRRAFIPRPGCAFVKADASQLEVRVYAEYTHEPVLVDAYTHTAHDSRGPKGNCLRCDVHQQVADALGIPRSAAKNTLFAAIYGAEEAKLAATARVRPADAAAFLARMRREIPSLLSWKDRIKDDLYRRGYVETLVGWINYYPLFASPIPAERNAALREAGNMPIQGTGAGIIKVAMTEADTLAAQYDAALVETVHDEVGYEVPYQNVVAFARDLQRLFRDVAARYMKIIPFVLEVSAGPNWGDCQDIPELHHG